MKRIAIVLLLAPLAHAQVNNVASPQQSTLKDFLTPLGATLDVSTLDTKQKAITLNFNPIPGQLSVETTFTTPKMNDALSNFIGNEQTIDKIEKTLSAADDVVLAVSFNRRTRGWGTSETPHRALIEQLGANAVALKPYLDNQPQLYFTAIGHRRSPVVGPNASTIRMTWEIGMQNLNSFYAGEGRDCGASCADAFTQFVKRTPDAATAARFNVALDYRMREKGVTPSAAPFLTMQSPHRFGAIIGYGRPFATLSGGKAGRLDFKVEYDGRKAAFTPSAKQSGSASALGRVSPVQPFTPVVTAPYDRVVGAATFTLPVCDRTSVTVSVIGADRIEPIVSGRLGPQQLTTFAVHAGVTFKLAPVHPQPCCCQ